MANRNIDVRSEMHRLAERKPVQAVAGVGVLASEKLRELPARISRLRAEAPVASLPARATGYVLTVRAKAAGEYDKLAVRGRQALGGKDGRPGGAR